MHRSRLALATALMGLVVAGCSGLAGVAPIGTPSTATSAPRATGHHARRSRIPRLLLAVRGEDGAGKTLTTLNLRTGREATIIDATHPPPGIANGAWEITGADLAPDGKHLAFSVWNKQPPFTPTVYFGSVKGGRAWQRIGEGTVARFSPDGRWIVVAQVRWTVLSTNGGAPVVSSVFSPYPPNGIQWSPDGRSVAYGEHFERTSPVVTSVLRFDATRRTLTKDAAATRDGTAPWWTRDGHLHTVPSSTCVRVADVDASYRWALSAFDVCTFPYAKLQYWRLAPGATTTTPLSIASDLEPGLIEAAW